MDYSKDRLERIFAGSGVDALVLRNTDLMDPNFTYITGFTSGTFESNFMIAKRDGTVLLTNTLEYDTAMAQRPSSMKVVSVSGFKQLMSELQRNLKGKRVGFNGVFLPYRSYANIKKIAQPRTLVDVSEKLIAARDVKSDEEISRIKKANMMTRKAFMGIDDYLKEGVTEKEIAARFDYIMRENGADGLAFSSIVAFGKNSALPHYSPGDVKLRRNSFVLIDAGARYRNYCADMTRTIVFKPDRKSGSYRRMEEMIRIVQNAQRAAIAKIKIGVRGQEVHNLAAGIIDRAANGAYKGRFTHGLGHSLGIEVHDGGTGFSPHVKEKLRENMIVTVEPGIYVPGFGGVRMEDDIIVRKDRAEVI